MTEQEFLDNYDITQYAQPSVAADIVLFTMNHKQTDKTISLGPLQVLMIKRATHPFKNKWALPGGFCQPNETFEQTAMRELKEETGVDNAYLAETKTFTDKKRDPRGWIVSDAFTGAIWKPDCKLRTDANAWEAKWFNIYLTERVTRQPNSAQSNHVYAYDYTLLFNFGDEGAVIRRTQSIINNHKCDEWEIINQSNGLAFDHALIITQLLVNLRETIKYDPRRLFDFLPDKFTIGELEAVYKAIYGFTDRVPNFRRTIQKYVKETGDMTNDKRAFRPAMLYTRNYSVF